MAPPPGKDVSSLFDTEFVIFFLRSNNYILRLIISDILSKRASLSHILILSQNMRLIVLLGPRKALCSWIKPVPLEATNATSGWIPNGIEARGVCTQWAVGSDWELREFEYSETSGLLPNSLAIAALGRPKPSLALRSTLCWRVARLIAKNILALHAWSRSQWRELHHRSLNKQCG